MSLTRFALDNDRVTALALVLIVAAGLWTFAAYPSREDPSITIREAVVSVAFPGMAPQRVEDLITRPLEERIRELPAVKEIRSDSKTGLAILHVTVQDRLTDLDPVWQDLRNKMADARADLPSGTRGPFVNDEVGLTAVATVALWSDGFSLAEMRETARGVRDRLYALEGIKKIELYGVQDERVVLQVSNARLAEYGIGPAAIVDTLRRQNVIMPGGVVEAGGVNVTLEPSGSFESLADIADTLLRTPDGRLVPLGELARITRGYVDPPVKPVYFDGRPAIVLSVSISEGTNSIAFGRRLSERLQDLENGLPLGYVLEYATYQPALVEVAVDGALGNLYQTLVIVLLVVVAFLGLRTGLIVGAFVPLTMLAALVVMRLLDIELQRMSIATMIIALGILVDNGIVVAEDIRTRLQAGEPRREALLAAGSSLAVPLLTSSLTTIFAFAPMLLAEGSAGEYTRSLSQVVTIVLLASWVLAMTVVPALCAWFMRVRPQEAGGPAYGGRFYAGYRRLLDGLLAHRLLFVAGLLGALVLAGVAFQAVPRAFFPASERSQYLIYLDLPAGSSIDETRASVERLTRWLGDHQANPEVRRSVAYVGDGGPRFYLALTPLDPDPQRAFVLVETQDAAQVPGMIARTRAHLLARHPEARAQVKAMWLGNVETGLFALRLVGPDAAALNRASRAVQAALREVPGSFDIKDDWENRILKVKVLVDQARARRAGVTSEEVAYSLSAFLDGVEVTDYREGDTVIPVLLRGEAAERGDLSRLTAINVYSVGRGVAVPLPQVAELEPVFQYGRIKRRNQERTLTVQAKSHTLTAGQILAALGPALEALDLPPGHRYEVGGELEKSAEARAALFAWLPAFGGLIVVLLVGQFNSFRRPLIILLTIPMSFIGALLGLLAMGAEFGFMVILGLFSLAGIIINNGIVLIDRIDSERAAGLGVREAVVAAGVARFRPILMTTVTTILGLMPLILSRDPLFYGLASVIAFGLLLGTVLTLGGVPVLYSLLFAERGR
jgi:multidrug efflux pump subunit AcrB